MIQTAPDIYVRFHGIKTWYRHSYSGAEVDTWADSLRATGARRVYAYFNNDRDGYAVKNANMLKRRLRGQSG